MAVIPIESTECELDVPRVDQLQWRPREAERYWDIAPLTDKFWIERRVVKNGDGTEIYPIYDIYEGDELGAYVGGFVGSTWVADEGYDPVTLQALIYNAFAGDHEDVQVLPEHA